MVSVVVPAFNEEKNIGTCIDHLMNQTKVPGEIVVVDNNSIDRTAEIAGDLGARVVTEKQQGMIPARNKGFNSARFEIIARCDADTRVPQDWVEKIQHHLTETGVDALCLPVGYYDLPFLFTQINYGFLAFMKFLLRGREVMSGPNMALKRDIWKQVEGHVCMDDRKVHEDIDLAMNIHRVGGTIKRDNTLLVQTSGRRIRGSPWEFAVEYPFRTLRTLWRYRSVQARFHSR